MTTQQESVAVQEQTKQEVKFVVEYLKDFSSVDQHTLDHLNEHPIKQKEFAKYTEGLQVKPDEFVETQEEIKQFVEEGFEMRNGTQHVQDQFRSGLSDRVAQALQEHPASEYSAVEQTAMADDPMTELTYAVENGIPTFRGKFLVDAWVVNWQEHHDPGEEPLCVALEAMLFWLDKPADKRRIDGFFIWKSYHSNDEFLRNGIGGGDG